jgi:hypothetical protein
MFYCKTKEFLRITNSLQEIASTSQCAEQHPIGLITPLNGLSLHREAALHAGAEM